MPNIKDFAMTKSTKKLNITANDDQIDLSLSNLTDVPVKEIASFFVFVNISSNLLLIIIPNPLFLGPVQARYRFGSVQQ